MTGLVLGVTVHGPEPQDPIFPEGPVRELTLLMRQDPARFGNAPALGFELQPPYGPAGGALPVPGPTLVLRRGEPVAITLVNRLGEPTAIHWHGMELESYYDGVHLWGGAGGRATPMIEPGGAFVARFTPPRAGTFIYHTARA